jgi:hypothetical protein
VLVNKHNSEMHEYKLDTKEIERFLEWNENEVLQCDNWNFVPLTFAVGFQAFDVAF